MSSKVQEGVEGEPLFSDLAEVQKRVWELLVRAANDRKSPMHTPTVATIGLDGGPRLRTVVLRRVVQESNELFFHTDSRAIKISELQRDARLSMHFYDAGKKTQIRLEGIAQVHTSGEVADEQWSRSQPMSREIYRIPQPPGEVLETPGIERPWLEDGRENFATVVLGPTRIEWLLLHHTQHRRAEFVKRETGGESGTESRSESRSESHGESHWESRWMVP